MQRFKQLLTHSFYLFSTVGLILVNIINAKNGALLLSFQKLNVKVSFSEGALKSFLQCLTETKIMICTKKEHSNTSYFVMSETGQRTDITNFPEVRKVSCLINLYPEMSDKQLHISCTNSTDKCNLKIHFKNKERMRYEMYEIRWDTDMSIINNSLADFEVETNCVPPFPRYILLIPIYVLICIVSVCAVVMFIIWWYKNSNSDETEGISLPVNKDITAIRYQSQPFVSTINRKANNSIRNQGISKHTRGHTNRQLENPGQPELPPISTMPTKSRKFRTLETDKKTLSENNGCNDVRYFELEPEPDYSNK